MQYKTIILEFLQEFQPLLHDRLRGSRELLRTVNVFAAELKANHEAWKETLSQRRPGSDRSQIASEALEMALKDLDSRLSSASPPGEADETHSVAELK